MGVGVGLGTWVDVGNAVGGGDGVIGIEVGGIDVEVAAAVGAKVGSSAPQATTRDNNAIKMGIELNNFMRVRVFRITGCRGTGGC